MKKRKYFLFVSIILSFQMFSMIVFADVGGSDVYTGYWGNYDALNNMTIQMDSNTASSYWSIDYSAAYAWDGISGGLNIDSYQYGDYSNGFSSKIQISGSDLVGDTRGMTYNYVKTWYGYKISWTSGPWDHSIIKLDNVEMAQKDSDEKLKTMTHEIGHSLGLQDLYANSGDSDIPSIMWQGYIYGSSVHEHDEANIRYKYDSYIN